MVSFRSLATLALAATSTTAFTIPPTGLPSGQYFASINSAGEQTILPFTPDLAAQVRNTTTTTYLLSPRQSNITTPTFEEKWMTHCGCGITLDQASTNRALHGIMNQCGTQCKVRPGESMFTIQDKVVAFICFGGHTSSEWINGAHLWLEYACGANIAGSAYFEDGRILKPVIGYMGYSEGLDFCRDSLNSPSASCPK